MSLNIVGDNGHRRSNYLFAIFVVTQRLWNSLDKLANLMRDLIGQLFETVLFRRPFAFHKMQSFIFWISDFEFRIFIDRASRRRTALPEFLPMAPWPPEHRDRRLPGSIPCRTRRPGTSTREGF